MSIPSLSVVIPVFNTGKFLARCLDSILAQEFRPAEIVVINDGSTDDSLEILTSYAGRDPRFRVLSQENMGQAVARNRGLDLARGDFVSFIDSDDFIDPDYFRTLVGACHDQGADMAITNGWYFYESSGQRKKIYTGEDIDGAVISGNEWLKARLVAKNLLHYVPLQLYRRSFLVGSGVRFDPGILHEDVLWVTRVLVAAKKLVYSDSPRYHYSLRSGRYAQGDVGRLDLILRSSLHNARELDQLIAQKVSDQSLRALLAWQLVDGGLSIFHKLEKYADRSVRRQRCRLLLDSGVFGVLWRHATSFGQRRRIARNYLKCLLLSSRTASPEQGK